MTVKEIVNLLSFGTSYVLMGARTGKKLASTKTNKIETIEKKWFDKEVTKSPLYCSFYAYKNYVGDETHVVPVINIWVSGE